jgi:hypothetical protein
MGEIPKGLKREDGPRRPRYVGNGAGGARRRKHRPHGSLVLAHEVEKASDHLDKALVAERERPMISALHRRKLEEALHVLTEWAEMLSENELVRLGKVEPEAVL